MADSEPTTDMPVRSGAPQQRIRVLVEGRVTEVHLQPIMARPRYEAEVDITASYRTVSSETRGKTPKGSFAAPTSAIAMDMPHFDTDDEAPLGPGTHVRLVWHGQRTVPGIGAGTRLRCSGMLADLNGVPVIYNPRYEIVSRHQEI
ncbi:hypothetical protein [Kocuria sp. HSID16901]|uniref:hypothetical protein n=1 Tax=Kocuria sp. HSID16901 TaxID=2419505 RepID=UPI00069EE1E2|nr:hypothetical protein [Kocuria sp. HSID16901]RUQ22735.1 hypothetical protein D8M21_04840 [Kocuria sp. HSID16901]